MQKSWTRRQAVGAAAAAIAACLAAPAQAVNKCTLLDGQVVYQDAPCQGAKAAEKVNLSGAGQSQPGSQGARIARAETAIANSQVAVGMSAAEVVRSWGKPSKVNASIGSYGRHEQWIYRRGDVTAQYVYVDNGRVTSIQTTE